MALVNTAHAQTASQVTPQTFEPQLQKQSSGVVIPEDTGPVAPKGAEKLTVRLKTVKIEGGLQGFSEDEQRVAKSLSDRQVTAAALFQAAAELERAYAARGYGLVRVVLPAQRLVDGAILRIVIIDGFVESVDTSHLPSNIRERIAAMLAPLVGEKGVSSSDIERRLLMAGDLPGTVLRSTLSKGAKPGGSVLTIEARYKPVTGFISADNNSTEALGRYNTGIGFDLNSVFGFGELFYLRASGAPRFGGDEGYFTGTPRNRSLAGGVTLPIGIDGLTLNLEATASRTTPEADLFGLQFMSDFKRYSARLAYPLIRSRELTLNVNGGFDVQNEDLQLLNGGGIAISKDRLRVLRAGADLSWYVVGDALISAGLTSSFGLDGLGARDAAEADASGTPLSRQGADADFQKLEINLGYRQPIAEHLVFDLRARAQTSFGQALLNSEQIGIVSTSGLSSFPVGSMQGDSGFVLRAEAQFPFTSSFTLPFSWPDLPAQQGTNLPDGDSAAGSIVASPYLFGSFGGVRLYQPTVLESSFARGAAYGLGLRLAAAEQASFNSTNVNLEYGRVQRFGDGDDENRFIVSAAFQF